MKTITITEYQACTRGVLPSGCVVLPPIIFESLRQFVLATKKEKISEQMDYLGISAKRGVGEILTAKNYVGVILLKNGVLIEILPKLAIASETDTRKLLIKMLGI